MSQQTSQTNQAGGRILFRLIKGFLYGVVIGLIFGIAIYLLASAVNAIAPLPVSPTIIFLLIFSTSAVAGTVVEYSDWLDEQI